MGSFEMIVSLLGLGSYEIWHVPFKNKVTVSYSPPVLPYAVLTRLQTDALRTHLAGADPCAGSSMWGSDELLLGQKLRSCDYPLIRGSPIQ